MAIDKSRTSLGVKIVLVFVAISMVTYLGASIVGFSDLFKSNSSETDTKTDVLGQIAKQHTGAVQAYDAALRSDPTSYTALVAQGNTYFDWAMAVQQASSTNQDYVGADQPMWLSARQYYERASEVKPGDPSMTTDLSIAYFYSGETSKAIAAAEGVTKKQADFAQAWFNLGIFYGAAGDNPKAIAAFEKTLALDPQGQKSNTQFIQEQLTALRAASGGATATSTPATTAPTTSTPATSGP